MGWFVRDRRGIGWKDQTLHSLSAPPLPLMVFLRLFIMLVCFATLNNIKERVERRKTGFRFLLLLMPMLVVLVLNLLVLRRRMLRYNFGVLPRRPLYEAAAAAEGGSASGYTYLLVLLHLLVMVYYQSSLQSVWFRVF